jgi:hypothetical protein
LKVLTRGHAATARFTGAPCGSRRRGGRPGR